MLEKIVHWAIAAGLAGWVVGIVLQLLLYGKVTAPCCGM